MNNKQKQYYISAPCGAGKTQYMYKRVRELVQQGQRCIIIHSTHKMTSASRDALQGIKTVLVSSENGSAHESMIQAINDVSNQVIIACDKTAFRLSKKYFNSFHVLIDDVTEIAMYKCVKLHKTTDIGYLSNYMKLTECEGYYSYTIDTDTQKAHNSHVADAAIAIFESNHGHDHLALDRDYMDSNVSDVHMLHYYDITKMEQAKSVIWLCANFQKTMVYQCYKNIVQFECSCTLSADSVASRMQVMYYMEHNRFSATYRRDNPDNVQAMVNDAIARTESSTTPIIHTHNADFGFELPGDYVSPRSQGVNTYIDAKDVIYMCSMLPGSNEAKMYQRVFGTHITQDAIAEARHYETLYQFVMRSNLRDKSSASTVRIIVPDKFMADYLAPSNPAILILGVVQNTAKKTGRPSIDVDPALQRRVSDFKRRTPQTHSEYLQRAKKWINKQVQKYGPEYTEYLQNKLLN